MWTGVATGWWRTAARSHEMTGATSSRPRPRRAKPRRTVRSATRSFLCCRSSRGSVMGSRTRSHRLVGAASSSRGCRSAHGVQAGSSMRSRRVRAGGTRGRTRVRKSRTSFGWRGWGWRTVGQGGRRRPSQRSPAGLARWSSARPAACERHLPCHRHRPRFYAPTEASGRIRRRDRTPRAPSCGLCEARRGFAGRRRRTAAKRGAEQKSLPV